MQPESSATPNNGLSTFSPPASSLSSLQHGSDASSALSNTLDDSRGENSGGQERVEDSDDGGVRFDEQVDSSAYSSGSESSVGIQRKVQRGARIARYEARGNAHKDEHVTLPFVVKKVPYSTRESVVDERFPTGW